MRFVLIFRAVVGRSAVDTDDSKNAVVVNIKSNIGGSVSAQYKTGIRKLQVKKIIVDDAVDQRFAKYLFTVDHFEFARGIDGAAVVAGIQEDGKVGQV